MQPEPDAADAQPAPPARPVLTPAWRLTVYGASGHFHVDTSTPEEAEALGRRLHRATWVVEKRMCGPWQPVGPGHKMILTEEIVGAPEPHNEDPQ